MQFTGVELFLDDELIAYTRNIRRELQPPTLHPGNPLIRREYPWEARHVCLYGSVLYDQERRLFRLWYNSIDEDYYNQQYLAYAESEDGINWTKPLFPIHELAGHTQTNVLLGPECNVHGPCVIRNPDPSDTDRRYLLLFDSYPQWRPEAESLGIHGRWCYAAESPDGLHWSPDKGRPAFAGKADSGQSVVWEPETETFRAYVRLTTVDAFGQRIRIWRLVESPDFVQWGQPRELLRTDERDGYPDMQIQQLTVTRYDGIYIGLLSLFRIKQFVASEIEGGLNEGPQVNYVQLVTSRDGIHFTRVADRAVFLAPSERGDFATHGFRTASQMLVHEDQVYIYCDGRTGGWQNGGMEIGLATLSRDRFVALTPERLVEEGVIELVPLAYPHGRLRLNGSSTVAGRIEAEVAGFDGEVIPGFERQSAVPLTGDELNHDLLWQSEGQTYTLDQLPPRLRDQPIRLRLWLRQARVHALRSAG
ncbi:MAG: hypothetical protein CL878_02450 [Dehalococcoidia bacterium]|nr:hypothetical protein [Dehalococcoidia bacterium]